MAWTVVPALEDLRTQLNTLAPNRDKTSDGAIGDTSHAAGRSSHNPDRTGNPEHRDGDAKDEVRARDFDVDLREPGLTMAMIVRHLVEGARAGRIWWLRYVIYAGVIYHKSTGFQARAYTGANRHDHHAHVNSDFTQAADNVSGVNYRLEDIPVALTSADLQKIKDAIDVRADQIEANVIARLKAEIDAVPAEVLAARIDDPTHAGRSVGDLARDLAALRGYLVGAHDARPGTVPEHAPIALMTAAAGEVLASQPPKS